jgi:hypothetical protein
MCHCSPGELPNKGRYGGRCNFTACADPTVPAKWYNRGSYAFYCEECAVMLNRANRSDQFCKDAPLCFHVGTPAEAATLHVSR